MRQYLFSCLRAFKFRQCLWILTLFFFSNIYAQHRSYNFRHVTTSDGLSSSVTRDITQDKYGYIWMATLTGLCRYNGYNVQTYLHSRKDPFSIPDNFVQGLITDDDKNIWIFFQNGLYKFDYPTAHFILQPVTKGIQFKKIISVGKDKIYGISKNGLTLFHPTTGKLEYPARFFNTSDSILLKKIPADICAGKNDVIYLSTDTGLLRYDPLAKTILQLPLKNIYADKIAVDEQGRCWASYGSNGESVLRTNAAFTNCQLYPDFLFTEPNISSNHVSGFCCDDHNRIWISTSVTGLCLYDSITDRFIRFKRNPLQPGSISGSNINKPYQDKQGFIWFGTEGYGVNYFNPDDNLFHSIVPDYHEPASFADDWARAATQDNNGDLWLGGVNGLAKYHPADGTFRYWRNTNGKAPQLYSNSIRSLLHDDHSNIWIGTSQGLNRYNISTEKMEFFGQKDSLPYSFFWSIFQDHNKNIWIGCREGLYQYSYADKRFEHFEHDPLLWQYCKYNILVVFEDSQQRIWLGTYKNGLIMYDPKTGTAKHWMKTEADSGFINNNIRCITEDNKGIIWAASNEGITAYDPVKNAFKNYAQEEGLTTVNASELMVDRQNRLWVGTGKGLFMLDSLRKVFKSFSLKDGLSSLEFNEQSAYQTAAGDFIYPSLKGFLLFNPNEYKEKNTAPNVYVSALKVFNKDYPVTTNIEDLKSLQLNNNENFFSFDLTAINFSNPEETWYAYKLEPFNKDWIYTKDRTVNYTNVPGGKYIFHFKASADAANWNVADNTIDIYIATVFYKTKWFWALIGLCVAGLLYGIYRYRIRQKEKIYSLQNKAQQLEKEKAIVQYESLKQQLNPHFLFNSLTSLKSLIRIDKQHAADFLDKMSLNYRYILKSSERELVPLKDELIFAKSYCDMQQTRFGNGLQFNISVDEELQHLKIVPVTIQNLVENAVKHNLIDDESPLQINITAADNYLSVSNNLQLKNFIENSNKYGLKHLQYLYEHLDARPVLIENDGKYFTVKIPLI